MPRHTPLYPQHLTARARMVDFAGWEMPIHYGSQLEEHQQVRRDAGVFDVSHMVVLDLTGPAVSDFLRYLLANDVARLTGQPGKALYSCMLNARGGVIDDLIVYFLAGERFRMVVNAATRDKDLAWIARQAAAFEVGIRERDDLAMIAVQGPHARDKARAALGETLEPAMVLRPFFASECGELFVARTGYTGEDGFEIMLPAGQAGEAWDALLAAGVAPIGLGARDTLRLEAGMNLYGQDMDEDTSPLESGLAWTVAFEPAGRDFIGRAALEAQRQAGPARRLVGLLLAERGMLRARQKVITPAGPGEITSGSFSPSLGQAIALARVPVGDFDACEVEIRGKRLPARVVKYPFVRHGKPCIT